VPKLPPAFKAETVPVPTANTVNRDTVNAAVTRVLGNPKVPEPNYGPPARSSAIDAEIASSLTSASERIAENLTTTGQELTRLTANVASLESRQTITAQEWEVVSNERAQVAATYNSRTAPLIGAFNRLFDVAPKDIQQEFAAISKQIELQTRELITNAVGLRNRINELAKKIQDGGGE